MGLSSATIEENRVGFILGVMLQVERIAGDLNFKMALQNETSNCSIAKDCINGKKCVGHWRKTLVSREIVFIASGRL